MTWLCLIFQENRYFQEILNIAPTGPPKSTRVASFIPDFFLSNRFLANRGISRLGRARLQYLHFPQSTSRRTAFQSNLVASSQTAAIFFFASRPSIPQWRIKPNQVHPRSGEPRRGSRQRRGTWTHKHRHHCHDSLRLAPAYVRVPRLCLMVGLVPVLSNFMHGTWRGQPMWIDRGA